MLTSDQLKRYSRQFILKDIGAAGQKKIMSARVLVIGAGALGSPALLYLTAAGAGTIGIADFDTVDLSNLQRQIVHRTSTVGDLKTQSAKALLQDLDPDVNIVLHETRITADNIVDIISNYDFVIDAADKYSTKLLINDGCITAKVPFVHCGIEQFYGQITTVIPGQTPCLRCLFGNDEIEEEEGACARYGVMGAVTGMMGSMEALEAIKYVTGAGQLLTGRILFFDGLTMEFDSSEYENDPDCSSCGSAGEDILSRHKDREGCMSCR